MNNTREINARAAVQPTDSLVGAKVGGDSLNGDGILAGDVVVFRQNFKETELTPGRLVAAQTPDGLLVKHYYKSPAGVVRLVSSHPDYSDLEFQSGAVEIVGVAVRIERDIGGEA